MTAEEVYDWLFETSTSSDCASSAGVPAASVVAPGEGSQIDAFDRHVVAAILSLAVAEGEDTGAGPLNGLGLTKGELLAMLRDMFPAAAKRFDSSICDAPMDVDAEEKSIRDILSMYCSKGDELERFLIAMIARRCKSPHHLWQDLGLRNRGELSTLMKRHFAPLASKNRQDMKWKKFLYRMVCGSEGFTLCTAPVCSECDDFAVCFGAEDGESRLAWARNAPPAIPQPAAQTKAGTAGHS